MLINSRAGRASVAEYLNQWADWVFHENRGQLKQLGIKSWLGELVKNNNTETTMYHEPTPMIDLTGHDAKMQLVDNAVKSLPVLQRETILIEYVVRRKDRNDVRTRWLASSGRTYNAHRKMLSTTKDILSLMLSKELDNE